MRQLTRQLAASLPYALRDKLSNYLDYVNDTLTNIALENNVSSQRVEAVRDQVELIFLLRLLYGVFVTGHFNYLRTLGYFERKQVSGFRIGSVDFYRGSDFSRRWRIVADDLLNLIQQSDVSEFVFEPSSIDSVLRRILGLSESSESAY